MKRVRFKEGSYGAAMFAEENDWLVEISGCILTRRMALNREPPLCTIGREGEILRGEKLIGTREDLEYHG